MPTHGETLSRSVALRIAAPAASTTAIEAIAVADRSDGMLVVDLATLQIWAFDANSATAASASVLEPTTGDGRWLASSSLTDLASVSNGAGASLIGLEDAGSFTTAATVEAAVAELYQHVKSIQKQVNIPLSSFVDPDGDPLVKFVNAGADGFTLASSEGFALRWNNSGTPTVFLTNVMMPQDYDDTADVTIHWLLSKVGTTATDTPAMVVTAFSTSVGSAFTTSTDFGGTSTLMVDNQLVQEVTLALVAASVPASPSCFTLTMVPNDLTTDDLLCHAVWLEYKGKLLTA
jgi:hypothetical protein